MNRKSGVYRIINNITGDYYVGSSIDVLRRFRQHKYNGLKGTRHSKLYDDIKKYGIENFIFEILEECKNYRERELYYINTLKPSYNTEKYTFNNMDRKDIKEKHQNILSSVEYRDKIKRTRDFTKEDSFKKLVSERSKEWWKNNYEIGCQNSKRAQSNPEYRKKRQKMAQAYREINRDHQPNRIPVMMFDENKKFQRQFLSCSEAAEYLRKNGFLKATTAGVRCGAKGGLRYKHYWKFREGQETIRKE